MIYAIVYREGDAHYFTFWGANFYTSAVVAQHYVCQLRLDMPKMEWKVVAWEVQPI